MLRRTLLAHLAVVNDGSRNWAAPFHIADVTLAQALYGRLQQDSADHYRFEAAAGVVLRLSMLVPSRFCEVGFRPLITLRGPGIEGGALKLPPGDHGTRRGRTTYRRTQRATTTLEGGVYHVEVSAVAGAGVYCFCVGTREPEAYADAATMARVQALLEEGEGEGTALP